MAKNKINVLVIDDDPVMLHMTEKMLRNDGKEVITAFDGITGIDLAKKRLPDLILLDVLMPGIGGIEVARRLQLLEETKRIPIIFMTVTINLADDKGDEEINVDGVMFRAFAKPLHQPKTLSVIRKLINKSKNEKK